MQQRVASNSPPPPLLPTPPVPPLLSHPLLSHPPPHPSCPTPHRSLTSPVPASQHSRRRHACSAGASHCGSTPARSSGSAAARPGRAAGDCGPPGGARLAHSSLTWRPLRSQVGAGVGGGWETRSSMRWSGLWALRAAPQPRVLCRPPNSSPPPPQSQPPYPAHPPGLGLATSHALRAAVPPATASGASSAGVLLPVGRPCRRQQHRRQHPAGKAGAKGQRHHRKGARKLLPAAYEGEQASEDPSGVRTAQG